MPAAPAITPIAPRFRWSVMVPSWNNALQLRATLASVLAQDLGPDRMQIVLVDDASTDDTAALAAEFDARVVYSRHAENVGAIANFNSCIEQAEGELIHILHADDLVADGFYETLDGVFSNHGEVGAATTVTTLIDEAGRPRKVSRSERSGSGLWSNALETLVVSNRVFPPSTVVRRAVYERLGGFRVDLPHAADWEMWTRIAANETIWFEDRPLAMYREHDANDTAARVLSGANIRERVEAINMLTDAYVAADERSSRRRAALRYSAAYAARTAVGLARRAKWAGARRQTAAAFSCLRASLR